MLSYSQEKDPYKSWIQKNEQFNSSRELDITQIKYKPLISVIIPVFNPPFEILKQTIDSVYNQSFPNYEICVSNASSNEEITQFLDHIKDDKHIKLRNIMNRGIAENTNEGLSLAKGEYVAFLDHDDLLSPHALLKVVYELNKNQKTDLIYSDSDKITENGIRYEPFFKPDYSPELMLCCNYMTHLCVIRKSLLDNNGGLSQNVEGAQDWDLILRVLEKTNDIKHIKEILYHWRTLRTSTATSMNVKSEVFNSQIVAVTRHLERRGLDGYIIHDNSGYLDCKLYSYKPPVSIIVIVSEHTEDLIPFLSELVFNTVYPQLEIILVSNKTIRIDSSYSEMVKVIENRQGTEQELFSQAVKKSAGQIMVFLHDDVTVLKKNWLDEIVKWFQIDEIGCVGSKITNQNEIVIHAGIFLNKNDLVLPFEGLTDSTMWTCFGSTNWYRNCDAVVNDGMAVRKNTLLELELFKKENADVDLCVRLRKKGFRVLCDHRSKITKKVKSNPYKKRLEGYQSNFYSPVNYYNPNLSKNSVLNMNI